MSNVYETRLNICKNCEMFNNILYNIYQCYSCKCVLNIKCRILSQQCPIGKWGKESSNHLSQKCDGCV